MLRSFRNHAPRPAIRSAIAVAQAPASNSVGRTAIAMLLMAVCAGASAAGANSEGVVVAKLETVRAGSVAGATPLLDTTINHELALDAARHWQLSLDTGRDQAAGSARTAKANQPRIQLRPIADVNALSDRRQVIPIQHTVAAAAILKTGIAIQHASQLKGQTVCLARDSDYSGLAAALHGALEQPYPTLTAALVALRAGACAAVVHDSAVLQELGERPEWKEYSKQLAVGEPRTLAFIVPSSATATIEQLKQVAGDWKARAYPASLVKQVASNVAMSVERAQAAPRRD